MDRHLHKLLCGPDYRCVVKCEKINCMCMTVSTINPAKKLIQVTQCSMLRVEHFLWKSDDVFHDFVLHCLCGVYIYLTSLHIHSQQRQSLKFSKWEWHIFSFVSIKLHACIHILHTSSFRIYFNFTEVKCCVSFQNSDDHISPF